jgi:hypothetical protein
MVAISQRLYPLSMKKAPVPRYTVLAKAAFQVIFAGWAFGTQLS